MNEKSEPIAIIGAGIIGVSTALWLQRAGYNVVLFDKKGPAEGASQGNAGVLASAAIVPVTSPGMIAKAPLMLLNPAQPLFMKWSYFPKLVPWLIRYLSHANNADCLRAAEALFPIIGDSLQDHLDLAAGTPAEKWIVPSDYLYLYRDRQHFATDEFSWSLRRKYGFEWRELEGAEFAAYDQSFSPKFSFAACLGNHGRITSPGDYVRELARVFEAGGGRIIIAEIEDFQIEQGQIKGLRAGGDIFAADKVVVTSGIWSGPLAKRLGLSLPLEAERGYHIELWEPNMMPRAPVMISSGKFVITPMEGRIRLAGIVEFGGIKKPPSDPPYALLMKNVKLAMPGLTWKKQTRWMGFRPALTDSIPLIGAAPNIKGAYLGFGHHHIGLTGGPKTGRLLASLVAGHTPNIDLSAYRPDRFAG